MGEGHSGRPVGPSTLRIFSVVGYPRWVSAFSRSAGSALLDTICIRCLLIKISIQTFFFVGSIHFEPAKRVWKSWAPPRCKFFIWLASLNRCWTADRLARRGLDHPDHPLCDQEDETIQHILTSCVFAREIWFRVLSLVGLQQLTPSQDDLVFQEWWRLALTRVSEQQQKGFNSSVILVAWWLWKHHNACVFDRTP